MNDAVQVIVPREVPLGGPRSMTVRRTLPARERSFVGAWCFVDHYGPDDVSATGGMDVAPHPHCGLATVSWLFSGEVEHRDSLGTVAMVRPGEVNLMTAGRGISHSEVSTPSTTVLHGAQLWVVLPTERRGRRAALRAPRARGGGGRPRGCGRRCSWVSLWGSSSPVRVETPLVGAEVVLEAGASVVLPVPDGFEVAVLVDTGSVTLGWHGGSRGVSSGVVGAARHPGGVSVTAGAEGRAVLVLGGEPFGEEVVMWWNFIGRTNDDVVAAREAWEAAESERFGVVRGLRGAGAADPGAGAARGAAEAPWQPGAARLQRVQRRRGGPGVLCGDAEGVWSARRASPEARRGHFVGCRVHRAH